MADAPTILTLRPETFAGVRMPVATSWLLGDCMEYRGKQDLWIARRPEVLKALREQAIIQSAESSNRIEGVTVSPERLRPVVMGRSRPRDRSEEELFGYRRALDWIFRQRDRLPMDARVIKHLHALSHAGAGDAGQFKSRDNEIIEITPEGRRMVRFRPTSDQRTPEATAELCEAYERFRDADEAPPLLVVATAVFDLLCIHPFRDGNGRVSRLWTTLLLEQNGFSVSRFVSLERLVEESKEDYYRVLRECSEGWAAGKNQIVPWWNYFLTILRRAYAELAKNIEHASPRGGKADLVRNVVLEQIGPFTLASLSGQLPGVSVPTIKKVLSGLKSQGQVEVSGRGAGARWHVVSPRRT